MKRERPRCEDCIYNGDEPCHATIGEPIEYCFRPKETDDATIKKEAIKMAAIICLGEKMKLIEKAKRWAEEQNLSVSVQMDLVKYLSE